MSPAQAFGKNVSSGTGTTVTPQHVPTALTQGLNLASQFVPDITISDIRMKTNIQYVGELNGIPTYNFSYRSQPDVVYRGVMAQDILNTPYADAVHVMPNGMYAVDYRRLGFDMEVVDAL